MRSAFVPLGVMGGLLWFSLFKPREANQSISGGSRPVFGKWLFWI